MGEDLEVRPQVVAADTFAPPRLAITGKLRRSGPIFGEDFSFLAAALDAKGARTPKIAIPSPSMAHFRGGRAAVEANYNCGQSKPWAEVSRRELAALEAASR